MFISMAWINGGSLETVVAGMECGEEGGIGMAGVVELTEEAGV